MTVRTLRFENVPVMRVIHTHGEIPAVNNRDADYGSHRSVVRWSTSFLILTGLNRDRIRKGDLWLY